MSTQVLTDIETIEDIQTMVDEFYGKVRQDELLGPVFNNAIADWQHHLPKMYRFWSSMLLGTADYNGAPFAKHIPLPIDGTHFASWINLFHQTVDEHFKGEKAEEAKQRASGIAGVFEHKLGMMKRF